MAAGARLRQGSDEGGLNRKSGRLSLLGLDFRATLGGERQQSLDRDGIENAARQPFGAGRLFLKFLYPGHGLTLRRDNLKQIASFRACSLRA